MFEEPVVVTQLSGYVSVVEQLSRLWRHPEATWYLHPWFRGHRRSDWPLLPSVYRHQEREAGVGSEFFNEAELLDMFKRRAPRYLDHQPRTHWEWVSLMQHHGLPTRLLDWTESALVALHFAVRESKGDEDAAVWALNPWWINKHVFREFTLFSADSSKVDSWQSGSGVPPTLPNPPIAVWAPHDGHRILAQRGAFTIHGDDRKGLDKLAAEMPSADHQLCKLTIPAVAIEGLRRELTLNGITESLIFPELDGLCRELKRRFFDV